LCIGAKHSTLLKNLIKFVIFNRWLDKLGMAASLGINVVMRQTFYGGRYGLIDYDTSDPNPVSCTDKTH